MCRGEPSSEGDLFYYMMNHAWHTVGLQQAFTGLNLASMLDMTEEARAELHFFILLRETKGLQNRNRIHCLDLGGILRHK